MAASAGAVTVPDAVVLQVINLNQQVSSTQAGALSNSTAYGSGTTSVSLGAPPTVSATLSMASGGLGGSARSRLIYSVEYVNAGASGNIQVAVNALQQLTATGSGPSYSASATTFLDIGGFGVSRSLYDCARAGSSATACGVQQPIAPFTVTLRQNAVYTVEMTVDLGTVANVDVLGPSQAFASASISSSFSVLGAAPAGGYFVFSAAVDALSPVPEPSAAALGVAGLAALLLRLRPRRTSTRA